MEKRVNDPPTVPCACARCERTFGPYTLEHGEDGELWPIDHRDDGFLPMALGVNFYLGAEDGPRKGPRTGSGLYVESFGSSFGPRAFLRVRCKCGRNEKLGRVKLNEKLFDSEGQLRLRDGALYL